MGKIYLAGTALTLMLLASGAYGTSSQQRATAVNGCIQTILDGSAKAYAKKAGRNPDRLSLEFKKKYFELIKAKMPEDINAIRSSCSCTIDFIARTEGRLNVPDMDAFMKKHANRMMRECPPPRF